MTFYAISEEEDEVKKKDNKIFRLESSYNRKMPNSLTHMKFTNYLQSLTVYFVCINLKLIHVKYLKYNLVLIRQIVNIVTAQQQPQSHSTHYPPLPTNQKYMIESE